MLIKWLTNMFSPTNILGASAHIVAVTLKLHSCPLVNIHVQLIVTLIGLVLFRDPVRNSFISDWDWNLLLAERA